MESAENKGLGDMEKTCYDFKWCSQQDTGISWNTVEVTSRKYYEHVSLGEKKPWTWEQQLTQATSNITSFRHHPTQEFHLIQKLSVTAVKVRLQSADLMPPNAGTNLFWQQVNRHLCLPSSSAPEDLSQILQNYMLFIIYLLAGGRDILNAAYLFSFSKLSYNNLLEVRNK